MATSNSATTSGASAWPTTTAEFSRFKVVIWQTEARPEKQRTWQSHFVNVADVSSNGTAYTLTQLDVQLPSTSHSRQRSQSP